MSPKTMKASQKKSKNKNYTALKTQQGKIGLIVKIVARQKM